MAIMGDGRINRPAARVIVVNQRRELLLFHVSDNRGDGSNREAWFTVGGGVEERETFAECAARELWEEIGLRMPVGELGPIVAVRSGALRFRGQDFWSDEAIFFVNVPEWTVDNSGFTDLERSQGIVHRWWPLDELSATDAIVYPLPHELVTLATRILDSGLPSEPIELSWE